MGKLRVGVIGLGMGRHHVAAFSDQEMSEVVAIADLNEDALKEIGDKHEVKGRYTSAEEMLAKEDLDIVAIATPNKFHKPLALAAFEAGCHVLCEKPMAMNTAEAEEMIAASRAADRRLMINFSYRFQPLSWQLKKEIEKGVLGDVYHAETRWMRRDGLPGFGGWFGKKELSGGGPLIDLGVHRLDFALWLMDYPKPVWVMAGTSNLLASEIAGKEGKEFDVEDFASALIKFDNGATLQVTVSWISHIREAELMETRLLGSKGGMRQWNTNEGYEFTAEFYNKHDDCHYNMQPYGDKMFGPGSSMEHFVDCIVKGVPHKASGEEGLIIMKILDAIYKSAAEGVPVEI